MLFISRDQKNPDIGTRFCEVMQKYTLGVAVGLFCLLQSACMPPEIMRQPLPEEYADIAGISGIPQARFWGDEIPEDLGDRLERLQEDSSQSRLDQQTIDILALSGGGANGAFGAGLLVGWTAEGTRPEFRFVTGVSTGALIAPFAFLGPEMDEDLERFYTTTSIDDILTRRNLLLLLRLDSAADSTPLRDILRKLFSPKIVQAIAAEHQKGRRLYVATTHLDAGRPVIWNIGEIASSNTPEVDELLADIFLASASIPGVFPPVFIQVDAEGNIYDEMHVDGGVSSQVFLYPAPLQIGEIKEKLQIENQGIRIFVIRNSQLSTDWRHVSPRVTAIAQRSIGALIRSQGIGDVNQIYLRALRDQIDFNLIYIPETFTMESQEEFDPVYMRALFDLGYEIATQGVPWKRTPLVLIN